MKVAIIGCGSIGARRAQNLRVEDQVVAAYDPDAARANALCANAYDSLEALLAARVAEVAVVATVNSACVHTVQACLNAGLDVLVEKPAARSVGELRTLRVPAERVVKVGFNHRFHPAFARLRALMSASDPIMYVRARYGNGARLGFDREWRSKVEIAGGGELLDQGVHVIDLASVLLPGLSVRGAWVRTHYWDMSVDDNAWALMTTPAGQTFDMHVSSTEWKNEFQLDVYTRSRKLTWQGLGRSYGPETLTVYTMKPQMGPPDVSIERFEGEDLSWAREWENFAGRVNIDGGIADAEHTLQLVDSIYRASQALEHPRPHAEWFK